MEIYQGNGCTLHLARHLTYKTPKDVTSTYHSIIGGKTNSHLSFHHKRKPVWFHILSGHQRCFILKTNFDSEMFRSPEDCHRVFCRLRESIQLRRTGPTDTSAQINWIGCQGHTIYKKRILEPDSSHERYDNIGCSNSHRSQTGVYTVATPLQLIFWIHFAGAFEDTEIGIMETLLLTFEMLMTWSPLAWRERATVPNRCQNYGSNQEIERVERFM